MPVFLQTDIRLPERPMKVEIALDPSQMQSLASRVALAPVAAGAGRGSAAPKRAPKPRAPRPAKKTAEELDAEMAVRTLSAGSSLWLMISSGVQGQHYRIIMRFACIWVLPRVLHSRSTRCRPSVHNG